MQNLVTAGTAGVSSSGNRGVRHNQVDTRVDSFEFRHKLMNFQIRQPGVEYHSFRWSCVKAGKRLRAPSGFANLPPQVGQSVPDPFAKRSISTGQHGRSGS
ncbi:MAG: hypothetical protein WCC27_15890 [Acidobacteriaceae bacterium]